ncbi:MULTISPECIES: class I SAM-dependent methyltransferase [Paraliobacillus]|uniref:class I SAM-dependent DNA methyltransferase n=1 Tax=Paraliobacillus TaxID=200903 RepID=UPI000DD46164|nr:MULTISPECIES: class I SAM-dependent methyltransferase [Paraliobacillus]
MSYNKMSYVYDLLMEDAPYDDWHAFTKYALKKYGTETKKIIDLGCGTGQITCLLSQSGYDLVGVDLAADMLSHAEQRASANNLKIQWVEQDLRSLNGLSQFDAAVSYCDVINYITTEEELANVFSNVEQLLKPNGLFLFDIHAIGYVESELKDQVFSEMYEDMGYVWFCEPGEQEGEVFHNLTFFIQDQKQYDRFDEIHHQRTFPIPTYERLLKKCGFEIKGLYADFNFEPISKETIEKEQRIFFVCQK